MMIKAGAPVDEMIDKLTPLLDGGRHRDRRRQLAISRTRAAARPRCASKRHALRRLRRLGRRRRRALRPVAHAGRIRQRRGRGSRDVLEAIAAKTDAGPCVTHVGPDGAGHFVKMVHNGIEYGDMQLIAEAYDVLRRGLGLTHAADRRRLRRMEPRAARVVPRRAHRARLPRRSIRRRSSRSSTSCSTRRGRRAPASGRRRSRSTSPSRSRRSPPRSTRACCRA